MLAFLPQTLPRIKTMAENKGVAVPIQPAVAQPVAVPVPVAAQPAAHGPVPYATPAVPNAPPGVVTPPGCQPGGKWNLEPTCAGMICLISGAVFLFSGFIIPPIGACWCPCDQVRVYEAPGGTKHFKTGAAYKKCCCDHCICCACACGTPIDKVLCEC